MDKWTVLSQRMQEERGAFLGVRISAESSHAIYERDLAACIERPAGTIVAFAAIWETPDPTWFELGSFWVAPEHRGSGIAREVYGERLRLIPKGARCLIITGNPKAAHLALMHGFSEVSAEQWFDQVPKQLSCGPCDRIPDADKPTCRLRGTAKCRMLVLSSSNVLRPSAPFR